MTFEEKLKILTIIFFVLVTLFSGTISGHEKMEKIECVDNLADYERYNWTWQTNIGQGAQFKYAQTSNDLPQPLQGMLEGDGIFYTIQSQEIEDQMIVKPAWALLDTSPIFLYIKYYGHIPTLQHQVMCVRPVANSIHPIGCVNGADLPATSELKWGEILIEMDPDKSLHDLGLRIIQLYFKENDIFLIDRISVVQGIPIAEIDQIKNLCEWGESPVTSTTIRPGFVCPGVGSFADPYDCMKFHVCQLDNQGEFWDSELYCPITTVWCQRLLNCETQVVCPCHLE